MLLTVICSRYLLNYTYVWYLSYLLGMLNDYFYTKSSDMLNKNTLGVKKVRGQEEAALLMNQRLKALISTKAKKFLL